MKVILYTPKGSDPKRHFQKMFDKLVPKRHAQIYKKFDDLSKRLLKPTTNINLAIFFIKDSKEIASFLSLEQHLSGLRIIMLLPDKNKKTLDQAYKLFPRYIGVANNKYDDLALVIKKITQKFTH